ncbi:MAG: hypothetical protein HXS46_15830 [Theionarchaea archaeon]|nr:MAG: hypothetical protein AYK18_02410 [Theionarchaea archaeon DG-70]MBU7012155.1 hypothetical protein [Theionarchaea archaeon]
MKELLKRIVMALCAGYILFYYSELVFWANYHPVEMVLPDLLFTYLLYSIVTYALFSVIATFKVGSIWSYGHYF